MSQELWTAVDDYVAAHAVREDDVLRDAVEAANAAGLPEIQVTPAEGRLLGSTSTGRCA